MSDHAFTKLFASIIHSTIWREPDHVRLVWVTMLAMADADGYVGASLPGLADAARVTIEQCQEALELFHKPDPHSRRKDHEGRRVSTVERGWLLLNYRAFRDEMNVEAERERKREWWRKNRSKSAGLAGTSENLAGTSATSYKQRQRSEAEAEAEAEAETDSEDLSAYAERSVAALPLADPRPSRNIESTPAELEISARNGLENSASTETDWDSRRGRAEAVGKAAAVGAQAQVDANKIRAETRRRAQQRLDADGVAHQRQENLKGKPPTKEILALEKVWSREMSDAYPDFAIVSWGAEDRGKVTRLLEDCGDSALVENALRYVVRNWKTIGGRFFPGKSNIVPTVGFLLKMRAVVIPESQIWIKHAATIAEWDRVRKEVADPFLIPQDLEVRARTAREELASIGLG
jgi:hypothetical protein